MAADLEIDIGKSLDNLIKLNEQGEKLAKTLIEAANAMSSASSKGAAAKNAKDFANAVDDVEKAQTKANKTSKEAKEFNAAEYEERRKVQLAMAEQKKAIDAKIKSDLAEKGSIDALVKENAQLIATRNKLDLSTKEGVKRAKELNGQIDANTQFIKKNVSAQEKQKMNIGDYANQIRTLIPGLGGLTDGIGMVNNGFKVLALNPIMLFLTGLVALFTLLYKSFTSTDSGANMVEAAFKSLGDIMEAVYDVGNNLITAFKTLFSGNFKQAIQQFGNSFDGFSDKVNTAYSEAQKFVNAIDAIEDAMDDYRITEAKANDEVARLLVLSKDQTKTLQERKNAIKEAIDIQKEEYKMHTKFALDAYNADLEYSAKKFGLNKDTYRKIVEMDAETKDKIKAQGGAFANTIVSIEEKQAGKILKTSQEAGQKYYESLAAFNEGTRKLQAQYSGFLKDEQDAAAKAREKRLADEIQKRNDQYSIDLKNIEIWANEKIGKEAKTEDEIAAVRRQARDKSFEVTKAFIEKEIDILEKQAAALQKNSVEQIAIYKKIADYKAQMSKESSQIYIENIEAEKKATEGLANVLNNRVKPAFENLNNTLSSIDSLGDKLAKALDTDSFSEKLQAFVEKWSSQISQLTSEIASIGTAQYENSISNIEAETKAVEKEKEDQLSLVKGNSEKEAAVEAAYNAKIEALNKKKAQQEYKLQLWQQKMSALQAAINTALAVTKFLSQGDVAGAIAAGVLGAIEVGIILSKKISPPALAKGTKDAKEGIYRVGEAGRELADINGKTVLFDKETITYLPEHAKVYSNSETEKILKNPFVYPQTFTSDVKGNEMVNQLVGLRKDIRGLRAKRPVVNVYNLNNNSNLKKMFK